MGNCQAAEAATVVIQHPGKGIERIYCSITAHQVMCSNPGHYVALVVSPPPQTENVAPVKRLNLLRPDDRLLIGHVYRLISFEDMLKLGKNSVKLGKLFKEMSTSGREETQQRESPAPIAEMVVRGSRHYKGIGRQHSSGGQWRPALQTIAEVGS